MAEHVPDDWKPKDPIPNEMHERFCQERSVGYSMGPAYLRVQDDLPDGKKITVGSSRKLGWRLSQNADIQKRIAYLKRKRLSKFKNLEVAIEKGYQEALANGTCTFNERLTTLRDAAKFLGKGENVNHFIEGSVSIVNKFVKPDEQNN